MKTNNPKFQTIDEYHSSFPANIQALLDTLRNAIRQVAPNAQETISYNIPTFKKIVHYAGYQHHIGLYPGAAAIIEFTDELAPFKTSKGAIQFPIEKPLPISLIKKIVRYRVALASKDTNAKSSGKSRIEKPSISRDIISYNKKQGSGDKAICELLAREISKGLPEAENKVWHGHPVWFLDGNPIVGYSKQKAGWRLMFWSGAGFGDKRLSPGTGKFKDASTFYTSAEQINIKYLKAWLKKSRDIQWDYKNIVKRKGRLERLK